MKECKVCAYPGKKAVRSIAAKTLANDAINIWVFWNNIKNAKCVGCKKHLCFKSVSESFKLQSKFFLSFSLKFQRVFFDSPSASELFFEHFE